MDSVVVDRPLVVDLDGTLLATDLLVESASTAVLRDPWSALRILRWLRAGRTTLKSELASLGLVEADSLPYRADVLAWLRAERASGRRLVLASASDARLVQQVTDHLGIFDEAFGTAGSVNLKGESKRDLLVDRFGDGGFDYVGNHPDDLVVWSACAIAHVVGDPSLVARAADRAAVGKVFVSPAGAGRLVLRALRPHQWAKNVLIAIPLLTSQQFGSWSAVLTALVAAVTFSLVASSVYVLNDIADVTNDRHHATKRSRPFASGQLSLAVGWALWPLLAVAGFAVAVALLPSAYLVVLTGYLVTTVAYTFWGKRRAVGDVILLGGLYTLRVVAGAVAIVVPLSMWLLTFSFLFFLSLALVKRVSELLNLEDHESATPERVRGRGYWSSDREILASYGVATSVGATIVFSLFVDASTTAVRYASPQLLWTAVPVLLTWLMRMWLLSHRGQMNEDPVFFALRDRHSQLAGAVIVAAFVAATVVRL